jgi:FkbM family methyltransferase
MIIHLVKLMLSAAARNPLMAGRILADTLRLYARARGGHSDGVVTTRLAGFNVKAYRYSSLLTLYAEIFLKEVYEVHRTDRPLFIIDAGANIGITTLYFKWRCKNAEVWAFEPNPFSYQILEQNVEQNRLKQVKIFDIVLSSAEGVVDFYVPVDKASLNGSSFAYNDTDQRIGAMSRRLSTLLGNRSVDVLKLDIEGSEWNVVEDLIKHDKLKQIRLIMMELHLLHDSTKQLTNLVKVLSANQFDVQVVRMASAIFGSSVMVYAKQEPAR